jgi:DEAD/DEAH box helicase domain-containing protein
VKVATELFETAGEAMERIQADLFAEWEALRDETASADDESAGDKARKHQRRRLEGSYLLGELAGRGFLPSYGFPTDVVPFVTLTAEERQRQEDATEDKNEDEQRLKARGWPSRQRDIAIYEYAPGRGIVVDGVVRESAGVTLNWKRPADQEDVREVQSMRQVNWCRSCGALASNPAAVQTIECPECGGSEFRTVRYLAPAGFAVDIRFKIHDDTRDLGGAPPKTHGFHHGPRLGVRCQTRGSGGYEPAPTAKCSGSTGDLTTTDTRFASIAGELPRRSMRRVQARSLVTNH